MTCRITFQAMRGTLPQHAPRGPSAGGEVIRHGVEEILNAVWSLRRADFADFGGSEGFHLGVSVSVSVSAAECSQAAAKSGCEPVAPITPNGRTPAVTRKMRV